MLGRSATAFGTDPRFTQPATDRPPSDSQTFSLRQHLDEVGVVELGIRVLVKRQNPLADFRAEGVSSGLASAPMGQTLSALSPIAG